ALDASRYRVRRFPLALVPERQATVVRDVDRAVVSERRAVRAAPRARDRGDAGSVPQRDALSANLRECHAPRSEPHRSFRKPEPRCKPGWGQAAASAAAEPGETMVSAVDFGLPRSRRPAYVTRGTSPRARARCREEDPAMRLLVPAAALLLALFA